MSRSSLAPICVLCLLASACGAEDGGRRDATVPRDTREAAATEASVEAPRDTSADVRDGSVDSPSDGARETAPDTAADLRPPDAPADLIADRGTDVPADMNASDASDGSVAADVGVDLGAPLLVILDFTGQVLTVANSPLGFDSTVRTAPVTGTLAYDLRIADSRFTDLMRGRYLHAGTSQFTMTVRQHTITGSGLAITEVENLSADTFRFLDGAGLDSVARTMQFDGADAPTLVLGIAITDTTGTTLLSDVQPSPWPYTSIATTPHTFSLDDSGGTLLMHLDTLVQR